MATINVTTTVDENNGTGSLSLREAVIQANGSAGDDTIVLGANQTYTLTRQGFGEEASATGDLDILSGGGKLTILASTVSGSTGVATINGGGIDRVFDVKSSADLTLQNLTVKGGKPHGYGPTSSATTGTFIDSGGGILNEGILNLSNVVITSNTAYEGGGIKNSSMNFATMNIVNSTISFNSAYEGGGIDSWGDMNITNSTISSNTASNHGGGGISSAGITNIVNSNISSNSASLYGGGINNSGNMNVANSTISSNSASFGGGAIHNTGTINISNITINSNIANNGGGGIHNKGIIYISNSAINSNDVSSAGGGIYSLGTMNIANSSISSNSATVGGGIYNRGGELNLKNTTITGNTANTSGLSSRGFTYYINYGSYVRYRYYEATLSMSNSIIAQNHQNKDIDIGTLTSVINQGYNLIGNATGVETLFNQTGDIIGTATNPLDAKLGPLQDNGGNTFTHALLAGSPAINAGNTDLTADQRGYERDAIPDIGAYEYLEKTPPSGATTGPDILIGTAGADTIDGLAGNDTISGLGGNDRLIGSNGDDSINGGTGDDTMIGGAGNDTYVVNSGRDRVTESLNAGRDSIFSTVTYTLPTNVENLKLQGTTTINGNGNGSPNSITGNSAANKINGGNGNDTLIGNAGNDSLSGGVGIDNLNGGGGNDTLIGDAGNDTITGSTGADRFLYNTNNAFATSAIGVDTITDFTKSQSDKIVLDKTTFTRISSNAGNGFSVASEFASLTSNWDRSGADIVYDRGTGKLFYNQNGTAAGYGTGGHFITLSNKPALSASDFIIQA